MPIRSGDAWQYTQPVVVVALLLAAFLAPWNGLYLLLTSREGRRRPLLTERLEPFAGTGIAYEAAEWLRQQ